MKSKYAPVIAIAALAIVIILALGWFLLIKPQLGTASEYRVSTEEVEASTAKVQTTSARLAKYELELAELPPLGDAIAVNAPDRISVEGVRNRIIDAARSTDVGVASMALESSFVVEGWLVDASQLPSTQLARLFQDVPVIPTQPVDGKEQWAEYAPPIDVPKGEISVVSDMYAVPLEVSVAGSYAEMARFLTALSDPEDQLLLVANAEVLARNNGAAEIPGVESAEDGDVILTITGHMYLLQPDQKVIDEDSASAVQPSGESPFAPSNPADG